MSESREFLLNKIDYMNRRLASLRLQGESSITKRSKNIRKRRNICIKELIKLLAPEVSYYDLINNIEEQE